MRPASLGPDEREPTSDRPGETPDERERSPDTRRRSPNRREPVPGSLGSPADSRPAIVLVPGIDGTGLTYHRQIPLLERQYAVTTLRLSDAAEHMEDLVGDLHAAIAAAAPEGGPVTVLGESFGGALSISYALAHPERVARLVILNSFAHIDTPRRLWLGYHLARVTPWSLMPVARRLAARRMHSPATSRDEVRRFSRMMRASTQQGYVGRLRILQSYDVRHQLHTIAAPVLYLASDRDHLLPSVDHARLMQSLTPNATLRVLDGHGHICLIAPTLDLSTILDEWTTGA